MLTMYSKHFSYFRSPYNIIFIKGKNVIYSIFFPQTYCISLQMRIIGVIIIFSGDFIRASIRFKFISCKKEQIDIFTKPLWIWLFFF